MAGYLVVTVLTYATAKTVDQIVQAIAPLPMPPLDLSTAYFQDYVLGGSASVVVAIVIVFPVAWALSALLRSASHPVFDWLEGALIWALPLYHFILGYLLYWIPEVIRLVHTSPGWMQ